MPRPITVRRTLRDIASASGITVVGGLFHAHSGITLATQQTQFDIALHRLWPHHRQSTPVGNDVIGAPSTASMQQHSQTKLKHVHPPDRQPH
ncbi:hypothetical protein CCHOA_05625 [Corynebacterium choanae]|uniref:Uncharacterized protein n=1 Tax=Corynebacterium choanae TaxID=1862358 RepID=A0A3G6J605_9CORY|nr:hypothetical protein CCHOA_05625 [Corynebacterium choanae]